MANVNKPVGLTPVSYLNGSDWDGRGNIYSILAADVNAFYVGDPVAPSASGGDARGIPAVTVGTPGTGPWMGVILAIGTSPGAVNTIMSGGGPYIDPNNLSSVFRSSGAKSVNYYALVADDPNIIYEAQEDSVGGAIAVGSIHNNINLIAAAPGTGVVVSAYQLDSSTAATTNTLDMRILRVRNRIDNAVGVNCKWEVMFNTHFHRVGTPTAIANVRQGV